MTTLKTFPRMSFHYNYLRTEERTKKELLDLLVELYDENPEKANRFYLSEIIIFGAIFGVKTRNKTKLQILNAITKLDPDTMELPVKTNVITKSANLEKLLLLGEPSSWIPAF